MISGPRTPSPLHPFTPPKKGRPRTRPLGPRRPHGRPKKICPRKQIRRYASSRDLCIFADAIRECLGLDPIHHDVVVPKPKNDDRTLLERFYRVYEWPNAKPSR